MIIQNFLKAEHKLESSHDGEGLVKNVFLYGDKDFDTNLSFIIYTELEPGSSIGYHKHRNDEEVYVI